VLCCEPTFALQKNTNVRVKRRNHPTTAVSRVALHNTTKPYNNNEDNHQNIATTAVHC